jgi:hypothetical protein
LSSLLYNSSQQFLRAILLSQVLESKTSIQDQE